MIEVYDVQDPHAEKMREWDESKAMEVEAQALYTAIMTDTYLDEDEEAADVE